MNAMRRSRRSIIVILILLLASSQALAVVKPTKITVKTSSKTIYVGKKATVKVKSVKPRKASRKVIFKSSNKKIATVSSKGVVTGKKPGKVTITVQSKYKKKAKAKVTITVRKKPATKPSTESVEKPEEPTLPEVVLPEDVDINEISMTDICDDIISDSPQYQIMDVRSYDGRTNSYTSGHLVRAVSIPIIDSTGAELDNRVCAADFKKKCKLDSPIVVFGGTADLNRRAVQLLVSQGADNSKILVATGQLSSEYDKYFVTVVTPPSGMVYNAVYPYAIHVDLDASNPLYRNLIDLREVTDRNNKYLRNSISVPVPFYSTTLAAGKRNIAALVEERGVNAIYVVICDLSEVYTDAGTTLLLQNGVPEANIVRIKGGLNAYEKSYKEDIVYPGLN